MEVFAMLTDVPAGRVFGLDQQTIISAAIHLINLAVLAFVMAKLLYKPVRDFMQKRNARIGDQIARVREEQIEVEDLKQRYEQMIGDIGLEREKMLEEAREAAELHMERAGAEAKAAADAMLSSAAEEIAAEKRRMQTDMRRTIIEASSAMAEKLVTISIDDETHERLFEQTMAELEDIAWE